MRRTRRNLAEMIAQADGSLVSEETRTRQREMFPERIRQWPMHERQLFGAFRKRVLVHGGYELCPPFQPDQHVPEYLVRGRTFDAYLARTATWRGATNQCHGNVADLFTHGEIDQIGTGFALSADGLWRQHSWGLLGDWTADDPSGEREIAETTVHRLLYYGVVLTQDEARSFTAAHL